MRFVEPKSEEQQAGSIEIRTREQLLKQRTDRVNSLRSHLQEFGYVAPKGIGRLSRLEDIVEDPCTDLPAVLPGTARPHCPADAADRYIEEDDLAEPLLATAVAATIWDGPPLSARSDGIAPGERARDGQMALVVLGIDPRADMWSEQPSTPDYVSSSYSYICAEMGMREASA